MKGLKVSLLFCVVPTVCALDCPEPPRFPGLTLPDDQHSSAPTDITLEMDEANELVFIRKIDNCYSTVYDRAQKTLTVEAKQSSYKSNYSYLTQTKKESQYVSDWLEWEKETRVDQAPHYTTTSVILEFYVPGSIAAFYMFLVVLSLIVLLFVRLCCKQNRVQYYHHQQHAGSASKKVRMAAAFAARPEDDNYGLGKDLKQFEMAKASASKWKKKSKGFSDTLMIDERPGSVDDASRPLKNNDSSTSNMQKDQKYQKDIFLENQDRLKQLQQIVNSDLQRSQTEKRVGWTDQSQQQQISERDIRNQRQSNLMYQSMMTGLGSNAQLNLNSASDLDDDLIIQAAREEANASAMRQSAGGTNAMSNEIISSFDQQKPVTAFALRQARKRKIMNMSMNGTFSSNRQ